MGQSSHQPQQQTVQQSVSLIGTPSSGTGIITGSLIPNSAVGSIPRTVPLTSLSQSPAWPASTQPQEQQQQWNLQQAVSLPCNHFCREVMVLTLILHIVTQSAITQVRKLL
ncbi:hypothetical protein AVEN_261512-1 [Araneus ventricosus]|uniref:Uncharacterized protein n=1 Tax=Araneus ventricosus TaxID=182803 RepID=A0A4Y2VK41_ARAVE|nr:hypothetical protein AVEN_102923-1 [Araneus ventricosus]GBO25683.1 hypothetical protein AVEN_261512-1 [Araneus ventricosus]